MIEKKIVLLRYEIASINPTYNRVINRTKLLIIYGLLAVDKKIIINNQ